MSEPLPNVLVQANALLREGRPIEARELLLRVPFEPLSTSAARLLFLLLHEAGADEAASALAERLAFPATADLISEAEAYGASASESDRDDDDLFARPAHATDEAVELFCRYFGGRRDVHARQWFDERRRRTGYHPQESPILPRHVREHLEGRTTLGQYLLFPDETCAFGVIDLDVHENALARLAATEGDVPALRYAPLRRFALALHQAASKLGLASMLEDSGGKGAHLWLFFSPRRPARAVREVLGAVLRAAGPAPPEMNVEVFPKQATLGPRGLSSLVKLPLGLHRATLRRCSLIDERGEPYPDALAGLRAIAWCANPAVDAVLGRQVAVFPAPERDPLPGASETPVAVSTVSPTPQSIGRVLRSVPPAEQKAGEAAVLAGCAVLRAVVRKAYESHRLLPAEARAVTYTLGLLGAEPTLAAEIMVAAQLARRELDRTRVGFPSPTGCSKLRRLDVAGATCAGCTLPPDAGPYATPVLFALHETLGLRPTAVARRKPAEPFDAPPLVETPLDALASMVRRVDDRLERLERTLSPADGTPRGTR